MKSERRNEWYNLVDAVQNSYSFSRYMFHCNLVFPEAVQCQPTEIWHSVRWLLEYGIWEIDIGILVGAGMRYPVLSLNPCNTYTCRLLHQ